MRVSTAAGERAKTALAVAVLAGIAAALLWSLIIDWQTWLAIAGIFGGLALAVWAMIRVCNVLGIK